jgi:tellurite resistance protein TerC
MLMLDVFHMPIWISLSFIVLVLGITAWLSIRHNKNRLNPNLNSD